jgi:hypothetical protein
MNNAQRFVFTSLVVVLALEFGSFTKLQNLWNLAFSPSQGNGTETSATPQSTPPNSITPVVHPS